MLMIELLKEIEIKYAQIDALYLKALDTTDKMLDVLAAENFADLQKLVNERETYLFSAEKLMAETQKIKNEICKKNKLSKLDMNEISKVSPALAESIETARLKLVGDIDKIQKIQVKIEEKFDSIKNDTKNKVNNVTVTKKIHNAYNKSKINRPVNLMLLF